MENEGEKGVAGGTVEPAPSASRTAAKPPLLPGGGSLDVPEREVDLEGTLNSTASKEFSFGTTKPAQLPSASQLEPLASAAGAQTEAAGAKPPPSAQSEGPEAAVEDAGAASHEAPVSLTKSLDELDGAAVIEAAAAGVKPTEDSLLSPKSDSEAGEFLTFGTTTPLKMPDLRHLASANAGVKPTEDSLLSPKSDSEAGELFTFGTTSPLKLPDLRHLASANDGALMPVAERSPARHPTPAAGSLPSPSGSLPTPERRTPRWEPADHQQQPLPPVQEVSQNQEVFRPPTPPLQVALPEQAFQLALPEQAPQTPPQYTHPVQVAQHWQMQQAPQMTPQYSHHTQVAQQWQMQQAQAQNWHEEVQKQQREAAELAGISGQLTKTHDGEEQHLAYAEGYGPYFNGEQMEDAAKVQTERSIVLHGKKRLAATGCIVILAVVSVGLVVLFVTAM